MAAGSFLLVEDLRLHAIHHQELLAIGLFGADGSRELIVHAVVLQLADHVLQVHEGGVPFLHVLVRHCGGPALPDAQGGGGATTGCHRFWGGSALDPGRAQGPQAQKSPPPKKSNLTPNFGGRGDL
jgi:hypothetical protein